jgi:Flp pilus assembly protein TadD
VAPLPGWGRALQASVWAGAALFLFAAVVRPFAANLCCAAGDREADSDPRAALGPLERAVALDPGQDLYWAKLGGVAETAAGATPDPAACRALLTRARQAFERAVALVPVSPQNHADLGRALASLAPQHAAVPAEAFAQFDTALAADPANAYFYMDAGGAALDLGVVGRARDYATRAAALYPNLGPARALLGNVAVAEGDRHEAARLFGQALRADWYGDAAGYFLTVSRLAGLLAREDRFFEAVEMARRAAAAAPEDGEVRLRLAQVLQAAGRQEEAAAEYRRLLGPSSGPGAVAPQRR